MLSDLFVQPQFYKIRMEYFTFLQLTILVATHMIGRICFLKLITLFSWFVCIYFYIRINSSRIKTKNEMVIYTCTISTYIQLHLLFGGPFGSEALIINNRSRKMLNEPK